MKSSSILFFTRLILVAGLVGCSASGARAIPAQRISSDAENLPAVYSGRRDLYVADYGNGRITILKNGRYEPDGTITSDINGPQGLTLDQSGNLYVANRNGGDIAEYAPGASSPKFQYNSGMSSPLSVSVDREGHVFAVDVPLRGPSAVVEYQQGVNAISYRCDVPGIFGVASDSFGDVYVDYNVTINGGGRILEYIGGLKGCDPTLLSARVDYAGGMVLDNRNDIIVADGNREAIDVIPPPYVGLKRIITGIGTPIFVSVDAANKNMFVSGSSYLQSFVFVVDYASGKILWQLGYKRDIGIPYGVVDGPDDVP